MLKGKILGNGLESMKRKEERKKRQIVLKRNVYILLDIRYTLPWGWLVFMNRIADGYK